MKSWLQNNYRAVFYVLILVLGLMQAGFTELQDDEAYYWVYSKFPDWGYFDHPPMIAFLIKAGYTILPNELGIRLFPLLLNVCSLLIIEKLTGRSHPLLFFAIVLSVAVIQLGGFMAVPDLPLIFFTALFFLCYRLFLQNQKLLHIFFLGLSIALLFYSKYHGLLVVFFTLVSNPRLFTRLPIWGAAAIALLFFAPHLWWQYQHDWISFRYHLFESNVKPYKISYTLEYIAGQLLFAGPIAGFVLLPAAILYVPKNHFEKALRYTLFGIYTFFLISTFRGRVEANWTAAALVPLMILGYKFLEEKMVWRKLVFRLLPATLVLTLFARIIMIEDIIPLKGIREKFHSWKDWPGEMKKTTAGLPVIFGNYYQYASKYWFYTGQTGFAQSNYKVRKNNFNFWPIEDSLLGKKVFVLDKHRLSLFPDSIRTPMGWIGIRYDSCYASFVKLKIDVAEKNIEANPGDTISLNIHYVIPPHYEKFVREKLVTPDTTVIGVFDKNGWVKDILTDLKLENMHTGKQDRVNFTSSLPKGKYIMRFAIHAGNNYPAHNSDNINLTIK